MLLFLDYFPTFVVQYFALLALSWHHGRDQQYDIEVINRFVVYQVVLQGHVIQDLFALSKNHRYFDVIPQDDYELRFQEESDTIKHNGFGCLLCLLGLVIDVIVRDPSARCFL